MVVPSGRALVKKRFGKFETWVRNHAGLVAFLIGFLDIVIVGFVVGRIPYTEIDWKTYMKQCAHFIYGERDYSKIEGPTGPLVYPANFLYIFSGFGLMTDGGKDIEGAQVIFAYLHAINVGIIARAFLEDEDTPLFLMPLLIFSRRMASIYVLRMFNDGVEAIFANLAVLAFVRKRYTRGCFWLSMAVGVKMNALLYAPVVGLLMVQELGWTKAFVHVILCIALQVGIAWPFLAHNWRSYVGRAFEFGRVFEHKWSVNYAFLSESVFQSKYLAAGLLVLHLALLILFTEKVWAKDFGGIRGLLGMKKDSTFLKKIKNVKVTPGSALAALYTCNFIGLLCVRTIHYQFYAWYYHTILFLAWKTNLPRAMSLLLTVIIEVVYNVYPPHPIASAVLHASHAIILYMLYLKENLYQTTVVKSTTAPSPVETVSTESTTATSSTTTPTTTTIDDTTTTIDDKTD